MKLRKLLALLAALSLLAAACGGDDTDDATSTDDTTATDDTTGSDDDGGDDDDAAPVEDYTPTGGTLNLLQWQAPSQANSLLSNGTKDILAGSLVLEPLAENSPEGELVPALAAEIPTVGNGGVAADFSSITWTLRDDVLWSDGTPFTADDVVFTYEYCADEATGCSVEAFTEVSSVVADDATTVTINFDPPQPYPYTPFVSAVSPIIQKAQMEACIGEAAKSCSDQNFAPVGTGPFMVTDLRPEDTVTYAYNPNYRGLAEGKPFFDSVVIKGGGDAEATARSVLEIGEADYAWNTQVAPEILDAMAAAGNGRVIAGFGSAVERVLLNQTDPDADPPSEGTPNPIFVDNPDLHRALSIAINRQELVDVGYGPAGAPTCNVWPVGAQNSSNNDWCLTQNIEEANALLDGLGYLDTDGDGIREAEGYGPLSFTYVTSTNAVRQSNQELVKAYWAEIGVEAEMRNEDASLFFDGTCASDVCIWKFFTDMQMFTNTSSSPYAGSYLAGFDSEKIPTSANSWGGDNIVRLNNADLDALFDTILSTPVDDPNFNNLIIEANDIISTTGIIPLIHRAENSAISNSIEGFGTLNAWDSEYWNVEDWTRAG
jgi:peptide/nickel transport system substrate-binding protein